MVGAGARALIERGLCRRRPRGDAGPARRPAPRFPRPLRRESLRRKPSSFRARSRRSTGSRTPVSASPSAPTSTRAIRSPAPARRSASRDRFAAICGRDSFPYFKPDPRHLTLTIERAGGDPARAVMVGDSMHRHRDRARRPGSPSSRSPSATRTFRSRDLGPDRIIDHFDELFRRCNRSSKRPHDPLA